MGIEILLYIIIGGFAGMLAGLLGVGGGLIIVPCLVFIYTYLGFNEDVLVHCLPDIFTEHKEKLIKFLILG